MLKTLILIKDKVNSDVKLLLRQYGWLLLSHHPRCSVFAGKTIRIKDMEVCRGCAVGYSIAGTTIMLMSIYPISSNPMTYFNGSIITCILGAINLVVKSKPIEWFCDISRGLALGFGLMLLFISVINLSMLALILDGILIFIAIIYLALRYAILKKRCVKCNFYPNIPYCPGLKSENII